jgi:FKBP-type peptidyl-prolyl cis-trans isomerase FklB
MKQYYKYLCPNAYQRIIRHRQIEKMKLESEENRKKGAAFLEANKNKEGVVTLASGLQYKILKDGKGPVPKAADTVECHYEGTLIDDTVFDSSHDRGKPAVFQVGQVIQGWIEALQIMKTGSVWMLYVPTDLAYGDRGAGDMIKPGATLVFKIELLGIVE